MADTAVNMNRPVGGLFRQFFCSAPHPDNDPESDNNHWCRRLPDHGNQHSAFTHSISTPEEWL